jgi:PKD domain
MEIYIDNKNLKTYFGIDCLDYSGVLSFAAERENEREWEDKSGVDKNLANIRYESKEFVLPCIVKTTNEGAAYNLVKVLVDYMFSKGCFVLSLRDVSRGVRECFICQRSNTIIGDISIREQNSLYAFKIGLKDINPNAVKYKTEVEDGEVTINYTKGQTAVLYWGQGDHEEITNSGNYTKLITTDGPIDIIIDIDDSAGVVNPLICEFSADVLSGIKPLIVQFADESEGEVTIWSWDFGDGTTSSEENPSHTYALPGLYTVILQIFNAVQGSAVETKVAYVAVRDARLMINDVDVFLINNTDKLLKN